MTAARSASDRALLETLPGPAELPVPTTGQLGIPAAWQNSISVLYGIGAEHV